MAQNPVITHDGLVSSVDDNFHSLNANNSVLMLKEFIVLSEMGNYGDQSKLAEVITSFKNLLINFPNEQTNLIEHMKTLSFESNEFSSYSLYFARTTRRPRQ
ncbi:hypothetical protein P20652_0225 [Pseudoalteromonas sp. BSi20652]|uniref:hypothetical protein n=1 Tax=Pseudoalteromonas sp. BSi20652 TaxID=388384 RepID=UPI000231AAFB|nr:hypothetical protein [Pseudoalteromonas sp. BSi20652]GAA58371.1 hypothetical protein P20652_0225 [Pseudoalteromonas sp. BSi20652]